MEPGIIHVEVQKGAFLGEAQPVLVMREGPAREQVPSESFAPAKPFKICFRAVPLPMFSRRMDNFQSVNRTPQNSSQCAFTPDLHACKECIFCLVICNLEVTERRC